MEPKVGTTGTKRWYDECGRLHRDGGPAVEWPNGSREWYQHGAAHRDDGPAIERADGTHEWYQRNQRHRNSGPAVVNANGTCWWYQRGVPHRDGGPAVEYADGRCFWYWHGEIMSKSKHTAVAAAAREQRLAKVAVLALDAARRRKRRAVHLPAELWNLLAEW